MRRPGEAERAAAFVADARIGNPKEFLRHP
jgi:hypothetical protein